MGLGGPLSPTCRGDSVCQRALEQKLPSNTTGLGHRVSGARGAHCGALIPLLRARGAWGQEVSRIRAGHTPSLEHFLQYPKQGTWGLSLNFFP